MNFDTPTIDRIVAGVLNQLSADGDGARGDVTTERNVSRETSPSGTQTESTVINKQVITADVLLDALNGESRIVVTERAIVTPAAWDVVRERGIEVVRSGGGLAEHRLAAHFKCAAKRGDVAPTSSLLIVVRNTDAVDRLWDDVRGPWQRELLGCPDDAATQAVSAVCRGDAECVVIFAAEPHRAACLANRNERVNAVVVGDAGDVRSVRSQLRANVWCVDPAKYSWFELRNLMRAIDAREGPR